MTHIRVGDESDIRTHRTAATGPEEDLGPLPAGWEDMDWDGPFLDELLDDFAS